MLPPWVASAQDDPLPSWSAGRARSAILDFVARVTMPGSPDFVPVEQRIATFDNDGTLWSEQPIYNQFAFVIDRIKALAPKHPEWKTTEPFKSVLAGNLKAALAAGPKAIEPMMAATHAGMTTDEFAATVAQWVATARHPRFDRPYTDLVYQPMVELVASLGRSGFTTYIVSGGGVEFMRPWTERIYGIPPARVIGSSIRMKYALVDDKPQIQRLAQADFVDDGPGKPVGIQKVIGRRPIFAAGNSDGDLQMLQWTTISDGPRFGLIVHHTDAEREWAYDRKSPVGRLDKALDEAPRRGWLVVDMKTDWRTVFKP